MNRSSSRISGLSNVMILFTKREDAMNSKKGMKNKIKELDWLLLLGIIGSIHNDERKVI